MKARKVAFETKRYVQWLSSLAVLTASLSSAPAQTQTTVIAWGNNGYGQLDIPSIPTNVITISAGANHNLALQADGRVVAWGRNNHAQATVPVGLSNMVAVAASGSHSLALKKDGHVVGWGANSAGQLSVPAPLSNVVAIATRGDHCLAVRLDGSVAGWGAEYSGQAAFLGSLTNAIAVAAGSDHALALKADGSVVAWGTNDVGQMNVPVDLSNVVAIAAGGDHCLALTADGKVVAWGKNDTNQASVPAGLSNVVAIAARSSCSMAVKADGTVFGWGACPANQPTLTNALAMSVGDNHAIALVGGPRPFVLQQPHGGSVFLGRTAYFNVLASGQDPISYQWQCQGTNIPGATNHVLAITAREVGDFGPYRALIITASGPVMTEEAALRVGEGPPVLWTQPADRIHYLNGTVVFRVESAGSAPLEYQWRFNGTNIAGADGPELQLTNIAFSDAGPYSVVISNSLGSVTSELAGLTVLPVAAWGGSAADKGQAKLLPQLTNAVAVAAGSEFSVALKADGTVFAWGDGRAGQTNVPSGLSSVVAVAAGNSHALALKSDGTVTAWGVGAAGYGVTNVPAGLSNVVAIAARGFHSFAIRGDGTVVGWGLPYEGEAPESLGNVVALAPGGAQCMALQADGTVVVWGSNAIGQTNVPPGLTNVVAIASGGSHCLALKEGGTVVAWGLNDFGQTDVPAGLRDVVSIAARSKLSLAVKRDGQVIVWGDGSFGQTIIPADLHGVIGASVGDEHCLALIGYGAVSIMTQTRSQAVSIGDELVLNVSATGALPLVYQWQFNGTNLPAATNAALFLSNLLLSQSGDYSVVISNSFGSVTSAISHVSVTQAPQFMRQPADKWVALGAQVILVSKVVGSKPFAYQWAVNGAPIPGATDASLRFDSVSCSHGGNYSLTVSNQFGVATSSNASLFVMPVASWGGGPLTDLEVPPGLTDVVTISAGNGYSLALKSDGTVVGWGVDDYGRIDVPPDLKNAVAIAAGGFHGLALKEDGAVVGWGETIYTTQTDQPAGLSDVMAIAAGYAHNLALRSNGTVVAWGDNSYFQTQVPPGLTNVVAISAGFAHSLALQADGSVRSWGFFSLNPQYNNTPASNLTNVIAVSAGWYHSLALLRNGRVVAWGSNDQGQTNVPPDLTNVVAISGGGSVSLALTGDGRVVAWGNVSQISVPSFVTNILAISAGGSHNLALAGFDCAQPPIDRKVYSGETVRLQARAPGPFPTTFQWLFNGAAIPLATNGYLILDNLLSNQAGSYDVVISNQFGSGTATFHLSVSDAPPVLLAQPIGQMASLAEQVTMRAQVAGSLPLNYQWLLNGGAIPHATNSVLDLGFVQPDQAGIYSVCVTNAFGSTFSSNATLLVNPIRAWGTDLYTSMQAPTGLVDIVDVAAGGGVYNEFALALRSNGTVVAWGATTGLGYYRTGLLLPPQDLSNVVAISALGSAALALLGDGTVRAWGYDDYDYGLTNIPSDLTQVVAVAAAYNHQLALRADGTVVAWGYNLSGQPSVPPGLSNVVAMATWDFNLALKGDGTVVAWGLPQGQDFGYLSVPAGLTNVVAISAGPGHALALRSDGTVSAWGLNGEGETEVPAGLSGVIAISAGALHSLALKQDGTIVAWGAGANGQTNVPRGLTNVSAIAAGVFHSYALASICAPSLTTEPVGRTAYPGERTFFRALASGARPLSYQWQFNGVPVPGATNNVLSLEQVQLAQTGDYSVVVANRFGMVQSRPARLAVLESLPFFLSQPGNSNVGLGHQISLEVSAQGPEPLRYQWRFNGVDIPGATGRALNLGPARFSQSGSYSVLVSNYLGSIISSNVSVDVSAVVAWGDNSQGQTDVPPGLTNVIALAAGTTFSLALRTDGTVTAWGKYSEENNYPNYLPMTAPANLRNVVAISAGWTHALALKSDGTVAAWGDNRWGQTNVPNGLSNVVEVTAGFDYSRAIKADGTIIAWGYNSGLHTPPDLNGVTALSGGPGHIIALKADGTITGWGSWGVGYYGDKYTEEVYRFLAGLSGIIAIATSVDDPGLFLKYDGTVVGLLSSGTPQGLSNVVAIAAPSDGPFFSSAGIGLALKSDGTMTAWGSGLVPSSLPAGLSNVVAISANNLGGHALALLADSPLGSTGPPILRIQPSGKTILEGSDAQLTIDAVGKPPLSFQWQFNGVKIAGATDANLLLTHISAAQSGNYTVIVSNALGTATNRSALLSVVPALITAQPQGQKPLLGGSVILSVAAQSFAPVTYQWRRNGVVLPGATNAILQFDGLTFAASGAYSVAVSNVYGTVTSADADLAVVVVAAWGDNNFGQTSVPPSLTNVSAIAAGEHHSLALRSDGTVVAWGEAAYGLTTVPSALTNTVAISSGYYHSLALRADGNVLAWGNNGNGQTAVPAGLTNVVGLAAGAYHSLALRADGTVVGWGWNAYGQANVPTGLADVVAVGAGWGHSLALRADGTIVAWGYNSYSFYGPTNVPMGATNVVAVGGGWEHSLALRADGTVIAWGSGHSSLVPPFLDNVRAIAAGFEHSLALRADGTVVVWGENYYDQTNLPPGLTNVLSIAGGRQHSLALVGNGSPAFTFQPYSKTVLGSGSVVFNAGVLGNPPMSFQWQFNGTNIAGATNASLQLANVQLAQAGAYAVVVSNALGVVKGKAAQLDVLVPPAFDPLPPNRTATVGSDVTFIIDATGTPPLRYQWRKNGVNLLGATNSTFTITNVQVADGASYSVVVANPVATIISDPTLLLVQVPSQAPPEDSFVNRRLLMGTNGFASGTNLFATREPSEPLHASKFGSNSVWYRWTAPTSGIATFRTVGSTFDTLLGIYAGTNVSALTFVASDEDRGGFLTSQARFNVQEDVEYEIAVDGFAGQQGSFILNWDLEVTADHLPVILTAPVSQTVTLGSPAAFAVAATGSGLTYQWFYNLQPIAGAKGTVLSLPSVHAADVGLYSVAVTNSAGRGVESLPVSLEIGSVAGVQSVGKLEDLLTPGGFGFAPLTGPHGKGTSSAGSAGGELLVGMGSINSQILNNTSPTNSGVPLPQTCTGIGGSARALILTPTNSATLVIDTTGSSIDTLLAVYTASGFTFTSIACDNNGPADGPSRVRFEALAGTRYLVAADGMNNAQGTIHLNWAMGRAPVVQSTTTNQVLKRGASFTLSVTISNAIPPARCQWMLNNQVIGGATNTTLSLSSVQAANAGVYSVLVSNAIQSVLQQVAALTLEPEAALLTASNFEHDGDAWAFSGEASSWLYQVTGGRFGGYLSALGQGAGGNWNWTAPGKFLGNQSIAYGGWLQFDLKRSTMGSSPKFPQVNLSGGGLTLYFKTTTQPGTNWTTYSIRLQEGAGWLRGDGTPALGLDLQRVLGSLISLQITGQFSASQESSGLGAVQLLVPCSDTPPPLSLRWQSNPAAWVLEWPASALCFQLEMADSLRSQNWTTNLPVLQATTDGGVRRMIVSPNASARFFRLRKGDALPSITEQAPTLSIRHQSSPPVTVLQWPLGSSNYQLEVTESLGAPNWTSNIPFLNSGVTNQVQTVTMTAGSHNQFFRLRKQ